MKVRHTTRCAGGCGRLLTVGQTAERRHRTMWCPSCAAEHASRCGRCTEAPPPRTRRPAGQMALF